MSRILFVMLHPGFLRYYDGAILALADAGHHVHVAFEITRTKLGEDVSARRLAAVCAASRRGTSLLNSCRNRFHPLPHWIQAMARSRRLIHRSSPCNTDGV